ncbi:TonB-dependent receptor [Sphingobacterium rhinopitheci]|uniref:TonB-dependent receptor n=1 Tax=Sphingobacterium rhinopitheci TaxID=2781960 RepID=UPI001F527DCB|nr:TonB-dependent receptor plug domain-containing protein [Sphingobacterium rhinopitheci]MCI0921938.1 TonB-dependent receptor plug domain-containing protein [Sphingobacterium rhinopitheci]
MKNNITTLLLAIPFVSFGQASKDSVVALQPVELKVHFAKQSLLSVSSSLHTLNEASLQQQQPSTLLSAMNTIAGVRMEERSPGSYRLAMRGSLIRSPFGIRNTKIYIDEFPLTDAAGNTYLNLIDPSFIHQVDIIKGPDGSLYGANSGGIIKMQPKGFGVVEDKIELNLLGGSYGLFAQQLGIQRKVNEKYQFSFNQSFTRSDGYRENSGLNKKAFQTAHLWNYNPTSQVRLYAMYTDLAYQTPGGLTQQQYDDNPRQARPAAGPNPSAVAQKAAIYNKTFFGALAHTKKLSEHLTHDISIYGSTTNFKNPFITNYEVRKESNLGLRTFLSWNKEIAGRNLQMQIGAEGTLGWNKIHNYDNDKGKPTQLQAEDDLDNQTLTAFYRAQFEILKNWNIEGSVGLNLNKIDFEKYFPTQEKGTIKFDSEWMPRIATNYEWRNMAWRISYAKGYSTPTLSEVRSSDNIINTALQAEKGNNYEVGYKVKTNNQHLIFDIAAYSYQMKNGILRQVNDAGQEYYSNVGEMNQKGLESTLWLYIPIHSSYIKSVNYQGAVAYNHYRFGHYDVNNEDLEGKKITAVPNWVLSNSIRIALPESLHLNLYHNYTSSSPLNDANTVFAKKYNLVQAKMTWDTKLCTTVGLQLYFGVDNLLNEKYSLGNDINAFGGRYFNAAPTRNYYAGVKFSI